MTIRQIIKGLTRERRVKKAILKIKADHMLERNKKDKKCLDQEFSKKYNFEL